MLINYKTCPDFFRLNHGSHLAHQDEIIIKKHHHHWKIRLFVALLILLLSFIGLIVSNISESSAWNYWRTMVPIFGALSICLSWYLRKKQRINAPNTAWREVVQWLGLGFAVYVVSIFVNIGLIGHFQAGLMTLTLLALNAFITGIYIEATFLAIGVSLGLFSVAAALFIKYIYTIMLPITIGVVLLLIWIARKRF